ncbi:UNVERIFIED_CONTAM: hypothetical protein FKN15_057676 [Acipenser sinensis]
MDRNALAELLQALESRRDAEERRREFFIKSLFSLDYRLSVIPALHHRYTCALTNHFATVVNRVVKSLVIFGPRSRRLSGPCSYAIDQFDNPIGHLLSLTLLKISDIIKYLQKLIVQTN